MATAVTQDTQFRQADFVGRNREMGELRGGLERALSGGAQLFLLSGEPGIGKTRVAAEIAREVREAALMIVVAYRDMDARRFTSANGDFSGRVRRGAGRCGARGLYSKYRDTG